MLLKQLDGSAAGATRNAVQLLSSLVDSRSTAAVDTPQELQQLVSLVHKLALAEMAIGGRTGLSADLSAVPTTTALDTHTKAFAESNSRYVLEVTPQNLASITNTLAGIPHAVIGQTGGDTVTLTDSNAVYLSVPVADCVKAHQTPAL